MNDLCFKVADALFRIRFEDTADGRPLLPSFAPFHVGGSAEAPLFTMTVGQATTDDRPEGEELGQFDCGGANHGVWRTADGYKMLISNPQGRLCCAFAAERDFTICHSRLYGNADDQTFGLNNALMIAFAFAGAAHGIVLMHASVPTLEENAYLFLGRSGTGKSTHSKLWLDHVEGAELLNDDNPAVRIMPDGQAYVYGTPWSGKTPCYRNLRKNCSGFLRLEQSKKNIIRRETGVSAFASILSSCSTMIWDKPTYNAICDTCACLAATVPAYHLRNLPEAPAARLSYNTIAR